MADIDLEEIRIKLYNKVKDSGWADKLKTFILSSDFMKILSQLKTESDKNEKFTPKIKYLFRLFEECPYNKLKLIIFAQDPYPYLNIADGIAFSCSLKGSPEASLNYIFKELNDTVYKDAHKKHDPDLARWSNQGVLLLNTSLTTSVNKIGKHYELWKPFIIFLLDIISTEHPNLVYVFIGKKTEDWITFIPEESITLTCTHPASAAYNEKESWNSGDIFNKINEVLVEQNKEKIIW